MSLAESDTIWKSQNNPTKRKVAFSPSEVYYQTGKDTIPYQSALHREFSDRAFNLLDLGVAALVAGAVVINFRIGDIEWTNPLIALGALTLLAFLPVAMLCLSVLCTGDWHSFPPMGRVTDRMETIREDYGPQVYRESGALLQATVGDHFKDAAQMNQRVLDGKSKSLFWAVLGLAAEILATISLVVLIFWDFEQSPAVRL